MKAIGLACAAGAVLVATAGGAFAQQIDAKVYHTLSTEFRGRNMRLDIFNGGPDNNMTQLAKAEDVSGQYWRIADAGEGYWRLTTMFRGKEMCLDVINGGSKNNRTQLTRCGNFSGQLWSMRRDGNAYRMTTAFRGKDMCLDITNGGPRNNQPELVKCDTFSGQYWYLAATAKPVD